MTARIRWGRYMKHSSDPIILLIDTDATARQILWDSLSSMNYRLLEASSASKGLALVRSVLMCQLRRKLEADPRGRASWSPLQALNINSS
jgi:hypothetical protein